MIKRKVTQIGNLVIRKKSQRVSKVSSKMVKRIIKDLTDSMRFHELIGMAAPQIGVSLRIFATELKKTKTRKLKKVSSLLVYINPGIESFSKDKSIGYEGCGSVAFGKLFGPVRRSKSIVIKAQGKDGEIFTQKASGLLARVIQHEMDHLNGIVFLDKVTDTRKLMSKDEYIKRMQ